MRKFHELRIQDFDSLYPEDSVIPDDSNDSATPSKELINGHKKGYHSNELFGSPDKGYHATIKPLLESYIGHNARPIYQIVYTADGVAIRSADNGAVEFTITDLEELGRSAVLCHNGIEPRNILVKQSPSSTNASSGGVWYELAAIIDWVVVVVVVVFNARAARATEPLQQTSQGVYGVESRSSSYILQYMNPASVLQIMPLTATYLSYCVARPRWVTRLKFELKLASAARRLVIPTRPSRVLHRKRLYGRLQEALRQNSIFH
ncbi:hypothetical protein CPLU01_14940 [Colletotrichum plurivorum]|uniref:Uncharacterized protein n=1 Tax=Colletotrichum plurivorum TaxID=2175906 RepID=A0A8H6MXV4_9PEZI|nr:hypothetical protein CPLU01_14940 [Colletotrichum plurivorum]